MLAHSGEAACKLEWWRRGFKQHGISFKQWFTEYRWCARARARARARTRARARARARTLAHLHLPCSSLGQREPNHATTGARTGC